jgi:hypothetical protein
VCKTRADYAEEEETYLHIILWLGVSGPFPASPSNNNSREVELEIGRGQVLSLRNVVFGTDTISFDQQAFLFKALGIFSLLQLQDIVVGDAQETRIF